MLGAKLVVLMIRFVPRKRMRMVLLLARRGIQASRPRSLLLLLQGTDGDGESSDFVPEQKQNHVHQQEEASLLEEEKAAHHGVLVVVLCCRSDLISRSHSFNGECLAKCFLIFR